jgi:hypothetical protein
MAASDNGGGGGNQSAGNFKQKLQEVKEAAAMNKELEKQMREKISAQSRKIVIIKLTLTRIKLKKR